MSPTSATESDQTARLGQPASTLLELSRDECLELLSRTRFGRLAVSPGEGPPVIRPLNYIFDPRSQSVVFRTAPGTKLGSLLRAREAAFEIDGIDAGGRMGWSVVIIGVAEEMMSPGETRRLDKLGLEVWAPGQRTRWVRIRARTVSGRRIAMVARG